MNSRTTRREPAAPSITTIAIAATLTLLPAAAAAQDEAKAKAGDDVYHTYCATCHGEKLVSTGQTFDLRRLTAADRPRFETSVLNGKNQMPPWKGALSDAEVDQIWHYIRARNDQK